MRKKILVLGGTGAIGEHLVGLLAQNNKYEIYVTSRKSHQESYPSVKYLMGDAHEKEFIKTILQREKEFEAIIDFMIYTPEKFESAVDILLDATKQYFFLSSATIYGKCDGLIVENNPRFVDLMSEDLIYQKSPYIVNKSKEEDFIRSKKIRNWTIIRPYISYAEERLQLGNFEKEIWLYRAMHNKTIVFPKNLLDKVTTLTYAKDVAKGIYGLIGNEKALGNVFHITTTESIKWKKVLSIYIDVIEKFYGFRPKIVLIDNDLFWGSPDRNLQREFDNSKFLNAVEIDFTDVAVGLENALNVFISEKRAFRDIPWKTHGIMDRMVGEIIDLEEILSKQQRREYMLGRFGGYIVEIPTEEENTKQWELWRDFALEAAEKDWASIREKFLNKEVKRIGLFACSEWTKRFVTLIKCLNICDIDIFIYDGDEKKQGAVIEDWIVRSPKKIKEDNIEVLLIMSKAYYQDIYTKNKHLEEQGVVIPGIDIMSEIIF